MALNRLTSTQQLIDGSTPQPAAPPPGPSTQPAPAGLAPPSPAPGAPPPGTSNIISPAMAAAQAMQNQPPPMQQPPAMQPMPPWQSRSMLPPPPPQMPQVAQPSIEQQALGGGGVGNKQQISNFMNALRGVGAGGNNGFMQGQDPAPQQAPQPMVSLVGPQATQQFNANQPPPPPPAANNPAVNNGMAGGMVGGNTLPHQNISQPVVNNWQTLTNLPAPQQNISPNVIHNSQQLLNIPNPTPKPTVNIGSNQQQLLGLMSDETQKENVSDATGKLHEFMGAIGAHNYEYKSPELDGRGTFTSPMAQELQKTELGKQAVIQTPRGLMVDYGRLGGVNLAAVSVVHREQQKLAAKVQQLQDQLRKRGK